ncbi:MAG: 2-oxoacid:acceptor oxidoreductase family protein [Deltaproteobacteria bacterium]|nr:2-oxoacid:acceptor oxidoreductase family protein [Deltaproteobacteria bacterium]
MADYTEIRWHGRAQQGIVTAAKVLAEAALSSGKYVQAFPEFGPERMGAPVRAFNRISSEPIRIHGQVTNPHIILIVDPTLIGTVNVTEGTPQNAVFIINTPKLPDEMKKKLSLGSHARVFTIDASKISIECIGRHIPNTPMLGAMAKATGVVSVDALTDDFKENYAKKYSPKVIEGNISAIRHGFEQVREG